MPVDQNLIQLKIERPKTFQDLAIGDSVAVNGVCLTVDTLADHYFSVTMAKETLQITGWADASKLKRYALNLERSLRLSDRVHGHPTSGHVDGVGTVEANSNVGGSQLLRISVPRNLAKFVWVKGSLAINGVSLTINKIANDTVELCLVPETLRRTNLGELSVGDTVTLEVDMTARALVRLNEITNEAQP